MKGTLHKTESGWHVINMQATLNGPLLQSLPLIDNGDIGGLKLYDSNEGLEVEFEIFDNREICNCICHKDSSIMHFMACCNDGYKTDNLGHVNYYAKLVDFPVPPTNGPVSNSISKYAKLVDKATRPLTENDAWRTMKEGDITVNFKPMPEFDDPKYPEVIANPIVLHKSLTLDFEVYPTDLGEMSWNKAKEACANLGNGWRLPTKDELNLIYENKNVVGGFADYNYWSSTEYNDGLAWRQDFSNSVQYYYYKYSDYSVRAVRALTKKQDNE